MPPRRPRASNPNASSRPAKARPARGAAAKGKPSGKPPGDRKPSPTGSKNAGKKAPAKPPVKPPVKPAKRARAAASSGGTGALRDASRPGAVRIQRFMADAGVASRRACEALIEEGRVTINGERVTELPLFVVPGTDRIEVDGEPMRLHFDTDRPVERLIYVMLHKPRQTVTTVFDPDGRRTVVDLVEHPSGARLFPVGRLDYDTMGLVLMTNDGELANRLTHPRYGVHKTYRAIVKGRIEDEHIAELERGVFLAERREGRTVGAKRTAHVQMKIVKRDATRTLLELTLEEGRNRQVRRMLAKVGHPVKKLTRVGMGPLKLTKVALGEWRELTRDEIRALRAAANARPE